MLQRMTGCDPVFVLFLKGDVTVHKENKNIYISLASRLRKATDQQTHTTAQQLITIPYDYLVM